MFSFFIICIIIIQISFMLISIFASAIVAVIISIIALIIKIIKNKELTKLASAEENKKRLDKFIPSIKVYKYLYIDEKNKLWCVPKLDLSGNIKKKYTIVYTYSDLIDFRIQENQRKIYSSNGTSRAIFGGAMFGKTGAIVGSNTAIQTINTSYSVEITVNNMRKPNIHLKVESLKVANEINSTLQLIRYENINTDTNISITDEIKKYKELLDVKAITEEEFELKKKEFLEIEKIHQSDSEKVEETDSNASSYNTFVSDLKENDLRMVLDNVKIILNKVLKSSWNVFRYFISICCILGGFFVDPIVLPFGISFFPLTYKILSKYNKKISKKTIKNISIILPIITIFLIGIFGEINYFKETNLNLTVGQNYEIDFLVEPENYKIISSNENVVIVEDNELKTKEVGTATIELYINEEVKDTIEITVKNF